jgi:hypothetical protein
MNPCTYITLTILDPSILNPFTLLDPSILLTFSLLVTVVSVSFSFIISWFFFRSYQFSKFGYLLGLPIGFAVIAISFVFEHLSLIYVTDHLLYPLFFWMQLTLESEALALIALSYLFKNRNSISDNLLLSRQPAYNNNYDYTKIKYIFTNGLPLIMIAIPFIVPLSELISGPNFNFPGLADLSFCIRIYNMAILCYIFTSTIVSLIKAANIKLLYIPAAFALLGIEQYSLIITYFDNSEVAFIGSLITRLTGLTLFVYVLYYSTSSLKRKMEIETREKT